jgi:hypothetical protein
MSSKLYLRLYLNLRKHQRTYYQRLFLSSYLGQYQLSYLKLDYQERRYIIVINNSPKANPTSTWSLQKLALNTWGSLKFLANKSIFPPFHFQAMA